MAKEHKLPKPASCATDAELEAYANQFDPNGDRRVLAVEVLRLRKIAEKLVDMVRVDGFPLTPAEIDGFGIRTEKPVKSAAKKEADKDVF